LAHFLQQQPLGRRLWLIRHGNRLDFVQPAWFTTALYPYDPPLCPRGLRQAQELGDRLATEAIQHIFVSPFLRTCQTALPCAARLQLPLKLEPGLGEWHNPAWMGRAPELQPGCHKFFPTDPHYLGQIFPQYPEAEIQVRQRSLQTLNRLLRQYRGNLLLIGHQVPLGICLGHLLGLEQKINLDVCALNELVYGGDRWLWHRQNETDFLSEPGIKVAP
jgi:broad specificity phosphatase PhoE